MQERLDARNDIQPFLSYVLSKGERIYARIRGSPSDIRMAAAAAAMTAGAAAAAVLFALAEIPHDMAQREIERHEKKYAYKQRCHHSSLHSKEPLIK